MTSFLDNVRFNPTAGGTTDWTYSSAVTGYQSPASAGVVNASTYEYFAISADSTQWEIGQGAYNTSTGVLPRTTVLYNSSGTGTGAGQSGAGTKISFSAAPTVAIVALAEDMRKISGVTARVHLAANQSVTASTATKIAFDTVDFDATSCWDATNHWFKPQLAGTYKVTLAVVAVGTFTAGSTIISAFIGKNGLYTGNSNANSQAEGVTFAQSANTAICPTVSTLVQLNGTTDTVEGDVLAAGTSPSVQGLPVPNIRTYMTIVRVGD